MINKSRYLLYPLIFSCFYMRLLAALLSIRRPNDEPRISHSLGIGDFTLPVIVTLILLLLIVVVSKKYRFTLRFNLVNFGLAILFSSIVILADMYFKIQVLG